MPQSHSSDSEPKGSSTPQDTWGEDGTGAPASDTHLEHGRFVANP